MGENAILIRRLSRSLCITCGGFVEARSVKKGRALCTEAVDKDVDFPVEGLPFAARTLWRRRIAVFFGNPSRGRFGKRISLTVRPDLGKMRRSIPQRRTPMSRKINFNAGPAALPLPSLERARDEFLDFAGSGMSVMEHSHRGKEYEAVHDEAIALVRELLGVPSNYEVLLLQGGATALFALIPLNFLEKGKTAQYLVTGAWGEKALGEAKLVSAMYGANVAVQSLGVGEGKEKSYTRVPAPSEVKVDPSAAYLHITSNETIHGVEFNVENSRAFPETGAVPLVADMSSDFLWRSFDIAKFGIAYAGAQKNIGPSGVVVAVISKELLERGRKDIPKIFQFRTHADNKSLYNTPPTFGVYMVRNVLAWLKAQGGLSAIEAVNRKKAARLYGVIDKNPKFFRSPVEKESRSVMNVVFRLPSPELEEQFIAEAKKRGMVGLKGHRSVGGIRVSMYNAASFEWVDTLSSFMEEFSRGK
jgi:phosphoserine aminotransferase